MAVEVVVVKEAVLGADAEGNLTHVENAGIAIEGGDVIAVGPFPEVRARHRRARLERFDRAVAFPGLVNGHHHIGITTFQHGVADGPLETWIVRRIAQRPVDPYLDTLYSAFEMVASGVTTVLHLYANRVATAREMHDEARACIRAYRDIGMRVSFAIMFFDQNPVGYLGSAFRESLSRKERDALGVWATGGDMDIEEHLAIIGDLRREFAGEDSVRIQVAPGNLQWCSEHALERLAEIASRDELPVHIHFLETATQRTYADWRARGRSPVAYLRSLGFSGPRTALGHGVWLRHADLRDVAEAGFSVCHNCSSNLRLCSGIAPVSELISAGVNVALGLDEAGLNDDRDMLQEMRLAMHLHKVTAHEPGSNAVAPGRLLHMATEGGAVTSDFAPRIGRIEAGRAADFFIFDAEAAAYPAPSGYSPSIEMLLHRGRPEHIRAVYCNGKKILADGRFTRIDREAALAEIADRMKQAPQPTAAERATLAEIARKLVKAHARAGQTESWFTRT